MDNAVLPVVDPINYQGISQLGLDVIKERVFNENHPEVIRWTHFFKARIQKEQIYQRFERSVPSRSIEKATVVLCEWHRFSKVMPWFLCQAASMVSNNRLRHYVIQTAFEELGGRDVADIHHEMFEATGIEVGIPVLEGIKANDYNCEGALTGIKKRLLRCQSDEEILGMLLGLEMPAQENIETVFSSLAYTNAVEGLLAKSRFFKIHRLLEVEHVRLNLANFLRFCDSDEKKKQFVIGFDAAIQFWDAFWKQMADQIAEFGASGGTL